MDKISNITTFPIHSSTESDNSSSNNSFNNQLHSNSSNHRSNSPHHNCSSNSNQFHWSYIPGSCNHLTSLSICPFRNCRCLECPKRHRCLREEKQQQILTTVQSGHPRLRPCLRKKQTRLAKQQVEPNLGQEDTSPLVRFGFPAESLE